MRNLLKQEKERRSEAMKRVVCLNYHLLPSGDVDCSYFGQVVTKQCCEECKKKKEGNKYG